MFEVFDRVDAWRAHAPTLKDAFIEAINHCVVEGLKILDISDMGLLYEDPGTGEREWVIIWAA